MPATSTQIAAKKEEEENFHLSLSHAFKSRTCATQLQQSRIKRGCSLSGSRVKTEE